MSGYLLDITILMEPLSARPRGGVLARLRRHEREVSTGADPWEALMRHWRTLTAPAAKRRAGAYILDVLQPTLTVLPFDQDAANWLATEAARLELTGEPPADPLAARTAAVAATRSLTVATTTPDLYAAFDGLAVEAWSEGPRIQAAPLH
jgi:predicted nucleic acid-binding protein